MNRKKDMCFYNLGVCNVCQVFKNVHKHIEMGCTIYEICEGCTDEAYAETQKFVDGKKE